MVYHPHHVPLRPWRPSREETSLAEIPIQPHAKSATVAKEAEGFVPNNIYHEGTELTKIKPVAETISRFNSQQPEATRVARCITQIDSLCALVSLW